NYEFTMARCRPQDRLTLMKMLEYVEGMSLEADITVFAPAGIACHEEAIVHDLPDGGPRYISRASGIQWVIRRPPTGHPRGTPAGAGRDHGRRPRDSRGVSRHPFGAVGGWDRRGRWSPRRYRQRRW